MKNKKTRDFARFSSNAGWHVVPRSRSGAMELSMSTIVIIVLSVSMLVVGVYFISRLGGVMTGVVDLTDQQLRNEINKLFSEESKITIYPGTRLVEIKQEKTDGPGVGIRNLQQGASGDTKFSYNVIVSDSKIQDKCGINAGTAEAWIATGKSEEDIPIPSGDFSAQKVLFEIPVGAPLCTIRFRVNVEADGTSYATDYFDMKVKAK